MWSDFVQWTLVRGPQKSELCRLYGIRDVLGPSRFGHVTCTAARWRGLGVRESRCCLGAGRATATPIGIACSRRSQQVLFGCHPLVGMKTVRMFSDRIRDRIRLKGFDPFVSESKYLTSDIVSVSEYLNRIFMMSISNRIPSLSVFESEYRLKYKNKYNISDIYPICFRSPVGMGTARLTRFCIDYPHRATAQQLGRQISARTHTSTLTRMGNCIEFSVQNYVLVFYYFFEND